MREGDYPKKSHGIRVLCRVGGRVILWFEFFPGGECMSKTREMPGSMEVLPGLWADKIMREESVFA
jgi:hypothetical protein